MRYLTITSCTGGVDLLQGVAASSVKFKGLFYEYRFYRVNGFLLCQRVIQVANGSGAREFAFF